MFGSDVIFLGGIATMAHTKRDRVTKDMDIILPRDKMAMLIDYGFNRDKKGK